VVVVAAAGYWFWTRSNQIKAERSSRDLLAARQSIATGNAPLAQSDLQKLVDRYEGTTAATQASLLLAELSYEKGEYPKGIDALQKAKDAKFAASRVWSLIGDGQLQLGKVDEATASYQKAADVADTDGEKAMAMAKKARAYMSVNKVEDARKVWSELEKAEWAGTLQGEAKVRLGELTAQAVSKS
jgi:tetratricopeptide (TPR) repeat protein